MTSLLPTRDAVGCCHAAVLTQNNPLERLPNLHWTDSELPAYGALHRTLQLTLQIPDPFCGSESVQLLPTSLARSEHIAHQIFLVKISLLVPAGHQITQKCIRCCPNTTEEDGDFFLCIHFVGKEVEVHPFEVGFDWIRLWLKFCRSSKLNGHDVGTLELLGANMWYRKGGNRSISTHTYTLYIHNQ